MDLDPGPFLLCPPGERPPKPRPIDTLDGLGDRMRTAAFAEYQAIIAFRWAADFFQDVPGDLREAWTRQVEDENRHYGMICRRMEELGITLTDRPVSTALWDSLKDCTEGQEFCIRIASAEERGRVAGEMLAEYLTERDPATAAIFQEIVAEEVGHVALADTYFGWRPE